MYRKTYHLFIAIVCLLLINSCKLVQFTPPSTNLAEADDHMGEFTVPEYKEADLRAAAIKTVEILNSPQFEQELKRYEQTLISGGAYGDAWQGWTSEKIAADLKKTIRGLKLETYGGPIAAWKAFFSGNLAFDGNDGYPIRLNRTVLKKRTVADLCNSIAHEAAHRIGLKHPHSDIKRQFDVALCEPPYVIGSIVKKLAESTVWHATDQDCRCFQ